MSLMTQAAVAQQEVGAVKWKRTLQKWFGEPISAVITLLFAITALWALPALLEWAVFKADFIGEGRKSCDSGGACWVFISERFGQFIYGLSFPVEHIWRVNVLYSLLLGNFLWIYFSRDRLRRVAYASLLVGIIPAGVWLLLGGMGLEPIATGRIGGLTLTMVIAYVGILTSLPLGIVLALGRRSKMPVVKTLSVIFIEFWRGVPLITVLFMASVMLPLFLPTEFDPDRFDKLLRCLIGVTLFSSAYMAEVVRGGLQTVPQGQFEAASAVGFRYTGMMVHIILPQVLRKVIPGIVNTFIGLFKDTTLVMIVGMFDLLGAVQAVLTDSEWLGLHYEGYLFAGFMFWIFCFGLSRVSLRIERNLGVAPR